MGYRVQWTQKAEKQFGKLDDSTKKRIILKIESILNDPFLHMTRLTGFNAYKMRVGNYRILIMAEKKNLIILNVGHRKNIYK